MKMNFEAKLLATELKESKKGNKYLVGLFQQGVDTLQLMLEGVNPKLDVNYQVEIEYSPRWKSMKVLNIVAK